MKSIFRKIIGFSIAIPFTLMIYIFSAFLGKEEAIQLLGPFATRIAKLMLIFFVPRIKNAREFDLVPSKIKEKFWLWKPLFDYSISYEDSNIVKLYVSNCPFYEAFDKLGLREMGPYICQGDWEIAKEYFDRWDFERSHQIGTGDSFCDPTYKRKQLR